MGASTDKKEIIIERLKSGESQAGLAREFGVSRQYVSKLKKRFDDAGEALFVEKKQGRPKEQTISKKEEQQLHELVTTSQPIDNGYDEPFWTIDTVKIWFKEKFNHPITRYQLRRFSADWKYLFEEDRLLRDMQFDEDFLKWEKSEIAQKIKQKEDELRMAAGQKTESPEKIEHHNEDNENLSDMDAIMKSVQETQKQFSFKEEPLHSQRTGKHSKQRQKKKQRKKKKK